ncbi:PLDc N-terminal domain-containing protein [Streptococcus caviae]|uniref:PLDc N-terminal domain-containing protein n=1 Tax=Streptococcus sp. 'caviae' TaxID=1915004 RepID=UPI00094B8EA8|nr:PLDc N-terminal domain-containing protein [Streptococcus sp. 'caviae']OLN84841.1 hypothetical protein BMI76_01830 [Streptococcus sp. 'caviae']
MNLTIPSTYLPFLIPLFALQLILIIIAFVKLKRIKQTNYLSKAAWMVIILCANILGPILFITIEGKKQ